MLTNIKELDKRVFQTVVGNNQRYEIETYEKPIVTSIDSGRASSDLITFYDITDQINKDFSLQNASFVFNLKFSLHNTFILKDFL